MKYYYNAYDERYKTVHSTGKSWAGDDPTPIVLRTVSKYGITTRLKILELGCGEGRDAFELLKRGYDVIPTDVSPEAVRWCKEKSLEFSDRFLELDCVNGILEGRFDFIYSVAVLHMLTEDEDRKKFLSFIIDHLSVGGIALICVMGDGEKNYCSDKDKAFENVLRRHGNSFIEVASTTCRIVDTEHFTSEIKASGLKIQETGITSSPPEFDRMIYSVVSKP